MSSIYKALGSTRNISTNKHGYFGHDWFMEKGMEKAFGILFITSQGLFYQICALFRGKEKKVNNENHM